MSLLRSNSIFLTKCIIIHVLHLQQLCPTLYLYTTCNIFVIQVDKFIYNLLKIINIILLPMFTGLLVPTSSPTSIPLWCTQVSCPLPVKMSTDLPTPINGGWLASSHISRTKCPQHAKPTPDDIDPLWGNSKSVCHAGSMIYSRHDRVRCLGNKDYWTWTPPPLGQTSHHSGRWKNPFTQDTGLHLNSPSHSGRCRDPFNSGATLLTGVTFFGEFFFLPHYGKSCSSHVY